MNHSSIARKQVKSLEAAYLQKNGGDLGGNGASMFFGGGRGFDTAKQNSQMLLLLHVFMRSFRLWLEGKGSRCSPGPCRNDLQSTTVREGGMGEWFTKQLMKTGQSREDGTLGILTA